MALRKAAPQFDRGISPLPFPTLCLHQDSCCPARTGLNFCREMARETVGRSPALPSSLSPSALSIYGITSSFHTPRRRLASKRTREPLTPPARLWGGTVALPPRSLTKGALGPGTRTLQRCQGCRAWHGSTTQNRAGGAKCLLV